ncbi:MAG: radical SAM protein, partial [Spirochaetaceae bacterium]|nr:radical SAM protein [Spirochaetaceae bacterium]
MKDTKMIAGETDISSGEASFYIHIPFCVSKCAYCDFFSIPVDSEREKARMFDDYLEALCYDIERQIGYFNIKTRSSLYVGGGTPSLLGGRRIEKLLSFLKRALPEGGKENVRPEITVEANSESLSEEFIAACVGSGVSRLSVGVQSLNDRSRDAIGRKGSSVFIKRNLDLLKNIQHYAGQAFDISFDLISGLPYQNKTMLLNDIETMLLYNPAHISLY